MSYETGYDQLAFFAPESGYGAAADPAGNLAARFSTLEANVNESRLTRQDRRPGSRSVETRVRGRREIEVSLKADDCPNGAAGAAPDLDALLATTYVKQQQALACVIDAEPAPTTSGCTISAAGAVSVGDLIGIDAADEQGDVTTFAVLVTEKNDDAISWTPTLPNAPAAGATVRARIRYGLSGDNQASVTGYKYYANFCECVSGLFATTWEYELDGGGVASIAATGVGKDLARFGAMSLGEGVTDSETEWTVNAQAADIYTAGRGLYTVDDEIVAVIATDAGSDELTVERGACGSTPAGHYQDAALTPYRPTPTLAGGPISGVLGRVAIGGAYYHVTGAKIVHKDGGAARNNAFGAATSVGRSNAAQREVTVELSGYLQSDDDRWQLAHQMTRTPVVIQAGTAAGHIHAFALPTVEFEIPNLAGTKEEEVPLTLTGIAIGLTPESELIHAYL